MEVVLGGNAEPVERGSRGPTLLTPFCRPPCDTATEFTEISWAIFTPMQTVCVKHYAFDNKHGVKSHRHESVSISNYNITG